MSASTTASSFVHSVQGFVANVPIDVFAILAVFGLFFAYGMHFGCRRISAVLIGLYVAGFIFQAFPFDSLWSVAGDTTKAVAGVQIGLFLVILGAVAILLGNVISRELLPFRMQKWIYVGILAASICAVLLVFMHHILPLNVFYVFSEPIRGIFNSMQYAFWILIAPLVLLFFTVRH